MVGQHAFIFIRQMQGVDSRYDDTNTSCHEWTSLTGESKRKVLKVQIHLTLVTFIIHVHCAHQLLPS